MNALALFGQRFYCLFSRTFAMQAFHDSVFPMVSGLARDLEDEFSSCVDFEGLERGIADNHFATIRDAVSDYRGYVASFAGSREKLSTKHAGRIRKHLRRIHNAVERVSARLRLSPDSKERLTTLLDSHKHAVEAHLKKRVG